MADQPLYDRKLVEPSCGHGSFLVSIVERLLASWKSHHSVPPTHDDLKYAIRAFEAVKAFWGNRDAARKKQEEGNTNSLINSEQRTLSMKLLREILVTLTVLIATFFVGATTSQAGPKPEDDTLYTKAMRYLNESKYSEKKYFDQVGYIAYDKTSVKYNNDIAVFWFYCIHAVGSLRGKLNEDYALAKVKVTCTEDRYSILYYGFFNINGEKLSDISYEEPKWQDAPPGSSMDFLIQNVCDNKPKK